MSENLDILNKYGEKTGEIKSRSRVHKDGDWHRSVHLWLIDKDKILFQIRSQEKKLYPNKLVATVSGHVSSGETPRQTLISEAKEEMNLDITKIDFFKAGNVSGSYIDSQKGIADREFIDIFIALGNFDVNTNHTNSEVAGFTWLSTSELSQKLNNSLDEFVPCYQEYEFILSYLKYN